MVAMVGSHYARELLNASVELGHIWLGRTLFRRSPILFFKWSSTCRQLIAAIEMK